MNTAEIRIEGDVPRLVDTIPNVMAATLECLAQNEHIAQALADQQQKMVWFNVRRNGYVVYSLRFTPKGWLS